MSNEQQQQGQAPGASPLSLLVNAVDTRDSATSSVAAAAAGPTPGASLHESMFRRGLGDASGSLRDELMRQKQADSIRQAAALHSQQSGNAGAGLLQQLTESQQLSQQLSQHLSHSDIRSVLANAHLRQAPQLSSSDIMALARTGALPGLSGIIGAGGLGGISGGSGAGQRLGELELQSLEELERRQRLLATGLPAGTGPLTVQSQPQPQPEPEISGAVAASPSGNPPNGQKPASMMGMAHPEFAGAGESAAGPGPGPRGGNPASSDKEQRRDPGSVVVPCRARGMPMDHNFKTAYFVIPENVRHGEELICSYFACRNAGVKFRYCSHCKVPVAKRNFRKRHKHGDSGVSKAILDDDDGSIEGSVSEENNDDADDVPAKAKRAADSPKQTTKEAAELYPFQDISRSAALQPPQPNGLERFNHLSAQHQALVQAQAAAQLASQDAGPLHNRSLLMSIPTFTASASKIPTTVNAKDRRILPDGLSQGGNATACASELAASVVTSTSSNLLGGNSVVGAQIPRGLNQRENSLQAQEEKWLALLKNRPQTTDGNTMSAWLMEVLAVSDPSLLVGKPIGDLPATAGRSDSGDNNAGGNEMVKGAKEAEAKKEIDNSNEAKKEERKRPVGPGMTSQGTVNPGCNVRSFAEWRDRKKKQKKG